MTVETGPIGRERAADYARAVWFGFYDVTSTDEDVERAAERWVEGRWWAATDDGTIVATVRTDAQLTTLPGGHPLATSGLTAVTTRSTHRRRGLLSEMLLSSLRADKELGEPLSTLIAAEWPIYGRFGYGPATEHASYTLKASARWTYDGAGEIELVEADALIAEAPPIYRRHHAANASEINRDDIDWRNRVNGPVSKPWKGFRAICRDHQGVATGYAVYKIEGDFDGRQAAGVVTLVELVAVDVAAEARLWRYLCEIDWITTIKADNRSVAERVPWWLEDGRDFRLTERSDFVWARPLDIAGCLSPRAYAAPLDLVIEVIDPLGLANGRYRLTSDGQGGFGECAPTTGSADLTVPISTLGSVLFGGYSLQSLATIGRLDEHSVGAVAQADLAFRTAAAPWSATWF